VRAIIIDTKFEFIEWKGYEWNFHIFTDPLAWGFGAVDEYKAWYYDCAEFDCSGNAMREGVIFHNWGYNGPTSVSNTDHFSARWEGYHKFNQGFYTFVATVDDFIKLWVDSNDDETFDTDELIISGTTGTHEKRVEINSGYHKVKAEYKEYEGAAKAEVSWRKDNEYQAWYYKNKELSGDPVMMRTESLIDWNWGKGSPRKGIVNADNFSVRWEGDFEF